MGHFLVRSTLPPIFGCAGRNAVARTWRTFDGLECQGMFHVGNTTSARLYSKILSPHVQRPHSPQFVLCSHETAVLKDLGGPPQSPHGCVNVSDEKPVACADVQCRPAHRPHQVPPEIPLRSCPVICVTICHMDHTIILSRRNHRRKFAGWQLTRACRTSSSQLSTWGNEH